MLFTSSLFTFIGFNEYVSRFAKGILHTEMTIIKTALKEVLNGKDKQGVIYSDS